MLSHTNMLANAEDAAAVLPLDEEDLTLSFLPLSHGFERTGGLYTILRAGGAIAYGGGIASLTDDLSAVRPTILCCVPRVLERVYQHMLGERESASFVKQKILSWALEVDERPAGHAPPTPPCPLRSACNTVWPTGWCLARCARRSADESAFWYRAAPRSMRTWPASFMAQASPSMRATA